MVKASRRRSTFLGFTHICGRSRQRWLPAETEDTARPDASAKLLAITGGAAAPDGTRRSKNRATWLRQVMGGLLRLSCRTRPTRDALAAFRTTSSTSGGARCGGAVRRTGRRGSGSTRWPTVGSPSRASSHPWPSSTLRRQTPKVGAVCGKYRPYGSVRGARSNARPYRDSRVQSASCEAQLHSAPWPSTCSQRLSCSIRRYPRRSPPNHRHRALS